MPKTFTFKWLGMAPWWVSDAVVMAGTVPGAVVGAVVMAGMAGLTPDPRETGGAGALARRALAQRALERRSLAQRSLARRRGPLTQSERRSHSHFCGTKNVCDLSLIHI